MSRGSEKRGLALLAGLVLAAGLAVASPEVILAPEEAPWLLGPAAAVAARLAAPQPPLLLATPPVPPARTLAFVRSLGTPKAILLRLEGQAPPEGGWEAEIQAAAVVLPPDPSQASIRLAVEFWGQAEEAVAANPDDPASAILAAALAAHHKAPLLLLPPQTPPALAAQAVQRLAVQRLRVVTGGQPAPAWALAPGCPARLLNTPAASADLARAVANGPGLVLVRVPHDQPPAPAAFLAPYLSLARRSMLAVCAGGAADDAEAAVLEAIRDHGLRPRSLTLLAAPADIQDFAARNPQYLGDYELPIEPFSWPSPGMAAPLGVGRIPLTSAAAASLVVARGLAAERRPLAGPPNVLMIANPKTLYNPLPLCEAFSRLTALEFLNFGGRVHAFYGKDPDEPASYDAAADAQWILFEGHVCDLRIFADPPPPASADETPETEVEAWDLLAYMPDDEARAAPGPGAPDEPEPMPPPPPSPPSTLLGLVAPGFAAELATLARQLRAASETPAPDLAPPLAPPRLPPELNASPLVILQSCHSLSLDTGSRIFDLGGAAVVGSMTNIHSAAGSAFMKTFCDAALYRGATAGEAMRDARNYFLCLATLRAARGHKEYAKSVRAALSFRLWGDPEARFNRGFGQTPALEPVRAEWAGPGRVRVTLPGQRLAEARSARYSARLFPGSQGAGIVARAPNSDLRLAMPVYFFRLETPAGFAQAGYTRLERPGDASTRAVFLADPLEHGVWVVYFPAKERPRESFELVFQP